MNHIVMTCHRRRESQCREMGEREREWERKEEIKKELMTRQK